MKTYMVAIGVCAALALSTYSATAGTQPSSQQPAAAARGGVNRTDALAALQDARTTLARLTEASLSHDAREALATVSTNFRMLYKAYTGEEPTPQRTAMQTTGKPSPDWDKALETLSASVDRVLNRVQASGGAVGTAGTAPGQPSAALELTTPVRQDFEALRSQLRRFTTASGHTAPAGR